MVCVFFLGITEISSAEISEDKQLYGISYSPLRANQSPSSQLHPSIFDIENDIEYLNSITNRLRIYDLSGNNQFIPLIAEKYGIKLTVGLSLSNDDQQNLKNIDVLIRSANNHDDTIETIIVGNDILAKDIMSESELIDYIRLVKNKLNSDKINVTISESWELWVRHPSLIKEVDHITIHVYPYYQTLNIDVAALYSIGTYERFQNALAQYKKEIVIGETGWPSSGKALGKAVASPENQRKYIEEFRAFAESNDIKYYIFEAFDEKWKDFVLASDAERNFGLFYEHGAMKESLVDLISQPSATTTRNTFNNSPDLDDSMYLVNYLEEHFSSSLPWTLNLVSWWNDESITNVELLNAIHYLIQSEIIEI